jgi:hypothetical protein
MTIWPSIHIQRYLAVFCALLLAPNQTFAGQQAPASNNQQQKPLPPDQLDSLVAPIALYPDPLLSQLLVASTYPLEVVEAARWTQQNSALKGKDLTAAAAKQPWDASVQALVVFPDVLNQMNQDIRWTTDLGNAFLAQESDVMQAVQRLRVKAQQSGKLESTPQQTVSTGTDNNVSYVAIQPANPEVIYVPQYDPAMIWGPPAYYPYPAIAYPSTGAVLAASAISFGTGVAIGAIWGGGWGWNAGWGHNNVFINNNFINRNNFNRVRTGNNNVWQHNPGHRAGVPYGNRNVADRYNAGNRMNPANRPTASQVQQRLGEANRQPMQGGRGNMGQGGQQFGQRGQGSAQRLQGPNQANRGPGQGNLGGQGTADRMGNRNLNSGNFGNGRNAFGDMNQGAGRARMNGNRGASSFGGGGGGFRGGGGGFRGGGGGSRGGGGGRRR